MSAILSWIGKVFNSTNYLASFIEESSNRSGCIGNCISFMLTKTIADKLFHPIKKVVYNPFLALLVILVLYIVFCMIYLPLLLCSYFITDIGSMILLFSIIVLLARSLARTMTFPGSTLQLTRDLSFDYLRRLSIHLENMAYLSSNYGQTLLLILTGRIKKIDRLFMITKYEEVQMNITGLSKYLKWMKSSLQYILSISNNNNNATNNITTSRCCSIFSYFKLSSSSSTSSTTQLLKPDEIELIEKFIHAFDQFLIIHATDFHPLAQSFCQKLLSSQQQSSSQSLFSPNKRSNEDAAIQIDLMFEKDEKMAFIYSTTNFVKHAGELKVLSHQIRPVKTAATSANNNNNSTNSNSDSEESGSNSNSNQENIIFSAIHSIRQLHTGPTGTSILALPIMREQLKQVYSAEEVQLKGAEGQLVDALYIPAAKTFAQPVGTVLFCCPNAGIYECLAQSIGNNSNWLSFYYHLGFNICYFNYRGYGRSEGVPTPARVKDDVEKVVHFLHTEKCTSSVSSSWPPNTSCAANNNHYSATMPSSANNSSNSNKLKLLVHGESLGGMVACSVAKNNTYRKNSTKHNNINNIGADDKTSYSNDIDTDGCVKMLVCDRTFCSLDAVASRMLGNWTSYGLRYLGLWQTNVVKDYLSADCHKVILQDPNDEIIANASSLRSGLSTYFTCYDSYSLWIPKSLPQSHQIALAMLTSSSPSSSSTSSSAVAQFPPSSSSSSLCTSSDSSLCCMLSGNSKKNDEVKDFMQNIRLAVANKLKQQQQQQQSRSSSNKNKNADAVNISNNTSSSNNATTYNNNSNNFERIKLSHSFMCEEFLAQFYSCLSLVSIRYRTIAALRKQWLKNKEERRNCLKATQNRDIGNNSNSNNNSRSNSSSHNNVNNVNDEDSESNWLLNEVRNNNTNNTNNNNNNNRIRRSSYDSAKEETRTGVINNIATAANNIQSPSNSDDDENGKKEQSTITNKNTITTAKQSLINKTSLNKNDPYSTSIQENHLHAIEKLWLALTRIDIQVGESLGSAFHRGYDIFRAWICNSIVWNQICYNSNSNSTSSSDESNDSDDDNEDEEMIHQQQINNTHVNTKSQSTNQPSPSSSSSSPLVSLSQSIELCRVISNDISLGDSPDKEAIQFILDAFNILVDLQTYFICDFDSLLSGGGIVSNNFVNGDGRNNNNNNSITSSSCGYNSSGCMSSSCCGKKNNSVPIIPSTTVPPPHFITDADIELSTTTNHHQLSSSKTSNQQQQSIINIGNTITLHTGHGGWPNEGELTALKKQIKVAGFDIKI